MKIGIDARMYGPGFTGIGRYTFELLRHLALIDPENEYAVFLRREAYEKAVMPGPNFTKILADFPHYSWAEQTGFLRLLWRTSLDLMHFTHFNAPVFYRKPSVVTIHDLTVSFFPGKKMTDLISRAAYHFALSSVTRHARRVIAVSKNTQNDLERVLHTLATKIRVIYHGVSEALSLQGATPFTALQSKFGLKKPFFLYTGVWRSHKNVTGMIRAFDRFNRAAGRVYQLIITGRPQALYREVSDTVQALGAEDDVMLVGIVPDADLAGLYGAALAYIYPSFYEGFGLPPLEAMALGTPVLASHTSAIPEVCGEENALYFDPYSEADMAEKMGRMATDASLRHTLKERGLARVRQFDWQKTAQQTLDVYREAFATHG